MKVLSGKKLAHALNDYVMIVLGLLALAVGYSAFLVPNNVVTGGVTGISTIIYFATGKTINVAIPNYTINVILLLMALRSVGKQFVWRTIFGGTVFSGFLYVLTPLFKDAPIVPGQPFMCVVVGSVICGLGLGLVYSHNGSSGGTDIIAAMVNRHWNVSFGNIMLICDLCIVSSSWFLFHDLPSLMYGYVFLVLDSVCSDVAINYRFRSVQFLIFSDKWQDIANAINNDAHRGCTLLHGTGWYTKADVKILLVVCRRYESTQVQRIVKAIDPQAFMSMTMTNGVFGKGFDEMKVRLKKYRPKLTDETIAQLPPDDSATDEPKQ